ncbi:MAG: hypothetical protein FD129_1902, partial [bacterium]
LQAPPPGRSPPGRPAGRESPETIPEYDKVNFSTDSGLAFPRLWEADLDRVLNGVIVVRRPSETPGQPRH